MKKTKTKSRILCGLLCSALLTALVPTVSAVHSPAIVRFDETQNSVYTFGSKPSLQDAVSSMPKTITVYLDGAKTPTTIPVTWVCDSYDELDAVDYIFHAEWDTEAYPMDRDYSSEGYEPFQEVVVERPLKDNASAHNSNANDTTSTGQKNIVQRAAQQLNLAWTPVKNLNGYHSQDEDKTLETYTAGTTYYGLPYGQPINAGVFVPYACSYQSFLNHVANPSSALYTKRGYNSWMPRMNCLYYSNDCSTYVSYCYGLSSRLTTASIAASSSFTKVGSLQNAQIGDCLNYGSHHVRLVTGITRNASGKVVALSLSEQTPPRMRSSTYSLEHVQSMINKGYKLLRYKRRDSVGAPTSYNGYQKIDNICGTYSLKNGEKYTGMQTAFHNCTLSLSSSDCPLFPDGTVDYPDLLIELDSGKYRLEAGVDYTMKFANASSTGKTTATITGINRFTGTIEFPVNLHTANVNDYFHDVPLNAYFAEPVFWAFQNGITSGTGYRQFSPYASCTRAQAVTFLWNAAGRPETNVTEEEAFAFEDVSKSAWYYPAVVWAVQNGITVGTSDTTFSPDMACTRAQIMTFLWKSAGCPEHTDIECTMTDVAADEYYYDAVLWAIENGITSGSTPTTFSPNALCTRAHVTTFLYRYMV